MSAEFDAAYVLLLMLFLGVMVLVMIRPERIYEYPYFMPIGYGAFMLPQLTSLYMDPTMVVGGVEALGQYCWLAVLCLGMCWVGYYAVPPRVQVTLFRTPLDPGRSLWAAAVMGVVALGGAAMLRGVEGAGTEQTGTSGIAVIYHFFTTLAFPALALALCLALRGGRNAVLKWAIVGVASVVPLVNVLLFGRRFSASFVVVIAGLAFYLTRGAKPPRWVIAGILFAGVVILPTVAKVRNTFAEGKLESYAKYDPVEMFSQRVGDGTQPEGLYGCSVVFQSDSMGVMDYGVRYWNHLVFRVIPGQLVGAERKNAMFLPVSVPAERVMQHPPGVTIGTVPTGVADSFLAFGYLGCLFFAVLGVFSRVLWSSVRGGSNLGVQVLYICFVPEAIRTMVFQTGNLLPGLAEYAIMWFFWLQLFAKQKTPAPR